MDGLHGYAYQQPTSRKRVRSLHLILNLQANLLIEFEEKKTFCGFYCWSMNYKFIRFLVKGRGSLQVLNIGTMA
jgi:hypothetical protein